MSSRASCQAAAGVIRFFVGLVTVLMGSPQITQIMQIRTNQQWFQMTNDQ
jgi:hypothetical protein